MKNIFKKYSFAALSITAICFFFLFTGGVHDGKGTSGIALDPPTIEFTSGPNSSTVGSLNTFTILVSHGTNPSSYTVTETCDLLPNNPSKTRDIINPEPEVKIELRKNGIVVYSAPASTIFAGPEISYGTEEAATPFTWSHSIAHPGTYELVCSARASSKTPEIYKNGNYESGGDEVFSDWTTSTKTITITGTAPLAIQRWTIKSLSVIPAIGDPAPGGQWLFSDPANQYLEIVDEGTANLKFKWTPPAGDTVLYPNLASKYDFNYTNAQYTITTEEGDPIPGLTINQNLKLYFQGQSITYWIATTSTDPTARFLVFSRPSKKVAGATDLFSLKLQP